VVDKFLNGVVTSIKSIDLGSQTYQNVGKLQSVLRRYVDKVAGFRGGRLVETIIESGQIKGRTLELTVPNMGTQAQRSILQSIEEYAASKGVTFNIVIV